MAMQPPCYRIFVWSDGRWRPHVTRTREPMRTVRDLEAGGWDRRRILIELRPGKGIPMPRPDAPGPVVVAGRVVG